MENSTQMNRKPVVAGQFYPGNPVELRNQLEKFFSEAVPRKADEEILAIIAPHAGYIFSGKTAACSFNQIDPKKEYKTIFLIGSSHHVLFDGASIYNKGNFETPLGVVPVDFETANRLLEQSNVFNTRDDAHQYEHSLEVQLPFLQYIVKPGFKIVPVIIATQNKNTCTKIAEALKPYFNEENLFVISTDFSHYPSYEDAVFTDSVTASAIITNDPEKLSATLKKNAGLNIRGLSTSMCGWTSVLSLMDITQTVPDIQYNRINYSNSGDAEYYGDKSRVVGYYSLSVTKKKEHEFNLTSDEKKKLIDISRKSIEEYIRHNRLPEVDSATLSDPLRQKCGAFVSLHINGELRGCIGSFVGDMSLYQVIQEMSVSSATRDYRFYPVKEEELKNIQIEISVLTPMKKISSPDEIILGKHGIYIKKDHHSGTFLPQVATSTGWTLEEFLGHCAKDKAGIGWEGWKDADIYIYEAIVFGEN